jgi:hypothetical protein
MAYSNGLRLAADAASTVALRGGPKPKPLETVAGRRCLQCQESWNAVNGRYCGRIRRYVAGAEDEWLRDMGCPMLG